MRLLHCCLVTLLLLGASAASARDIPRADPNRIAILDAVRRSPEVRLVVKDIFRSGDFAWLCVLESTNGVIRGTDDAFDVLTFALLLDHGKWIVESAGGGLASSVRSAECGSELTEAAGLNGPPASEDDLKALWQGVIRRILLDDLRWGHWGKKLDGVRSKIAMLKEHGVREDFGIDHPKVKLDQVQFDVAMQQCGKDARCRKTMAQAATDLTRLHGDSRVSSLVWDNCQYGLRMLRTDLIAQCVSTHMLKPYCSSGLSYFQNKNEIQHCLADITLQCRSLPFASEVDRSTVCFN
jgi:hypothetical protein